MAFVKGVLTTEEIRKMSREELLDALGINDPTDDDLREMLVATRAEQACPFWEMTPSEREGIEDLRRRARAIENITADDWRTVVTGKPSSKPTGKVK